MYETTDALFTGICDAIREKDGTTEPISHQQIPARIAAISGGEEAFMSPFYTNSSGGIRIENMVVSEFDEGNAIYTPDSFTPFDRPWEIQIKFKLKENSKKSRNFLLGVVPYNTANNCPYIAVRNLNTDIAVGIPDKDGKTWKMYVAEYAFSVHTDYWIKFIREESKYFLQISTNGAEYENIIQFDYADEPYQDDKSKLKFGGYGGDINAALAGSIDLKETYIKIGDEIWWGKGAGK